MTNGLKKEDSAALKGLAVLLLIFTTATVLQTESKDIRWICAG